MYAYVFDSYLQDRRYQHDISQIENRLATLGIQGRSEKMTILKNMAESVRQAIKRGATTIVIVGNDATVTRLLPHLVGQPITLGLIPLGPHQTIARALGIPDGLAACDVISKRIIHKLDLGKANTAYFLLNLTTAPGATVTCDGQYSISTDDPTSVIAVTNFPGPESHGRPDDGRLELVVSPGEGGRRWSPFRRTSATSVFPIRQAKVTSVDAPVNLLLDGLVTMKTPVTVEAAPGKLEIIVGRNRGF